MSGVQCVTQHLVAPAECAEAALPKEDDDSDKTLAGAKYTIPQDSEPAHSDDDLDEDSDLESRDTSDTASDDSDVDSEMEVDVRAASNKRKRGDKGKGKKGQKASKKKTGKDGSGNSKKGKRKLDEGNQQGGSRKRARRDLERGIGDSESEPARARAKPGAQEAEQLGQRAGKLLMDRDFEKSR